VPAQGYVLDFSSVSSGANLLFANLIEHAYDDTGGYKFFSNNCGHAFQRAINELG